MKFKKSDFFIQMQDKSFQIRSGYTDSDNEYTFHKSANGWIGSDKESGSFIVWRETRKACAQFIEENLEKINKAREGEYYAASVDRMRKFLNDSAKSN